MQNLIVRTGAPSITMRVAPTRDMSNPKMVKVNPKSTSVAQSSSSRKGMGRLVDSVAGKRNFKTTKGGGSISGLASIMTKFRQHRQQRRQTLGSRVLFAGMGIFFMSANMNVLSMILFSLGLASAEVCVPVLVVGFIGVQAGFVMMSMADIDIDAVFNESQPKITGMVWGNLLGIVFALVALMGLPVLVAGIPPIYALYFLRTPRRGVFSDCFIALIKMYLIDFSLATGTRMLGWRSFHPDWGLRSLGINSVDIERNSVAEVVLIGSCLIGGVVVPFVYARLKQHMTKTRIVFFLMSSYFLPALGLVFALEYW